MLKIAFSTMLLASTISLAPAILAAPTTQAATITTKASVLTFTNLVDMEQAAVKQYAEKPLFGTKVDGKYRWMTYSEFGTQVDSLRGGLAELGIAADDKVAVIANNGPEWAVICYATMGLRAAMVPLYTNAGMEDWKYKLADSGAKVVFVENDKILQQVRTLAVEIPSIQYVVNLAGLANNQQGDLTYWGLVAKGAAHPAAALQPRGDDTMGFIYTSGTTGKPKGVLLSHDNIASTLRSLPERIDISGERSLSFLPWAHIFGQLAELHALLLYGNSTGFAYDRSTIIKNLGEVHPTILFSVPLIFNRIYDKVKKDTADSAIKRYLYHKWEKSVALKQEGKQDGPIDRRLGKLFAKKVRNVFGGKLKYAVSGGAKLDPTIGHFIDDLGITVLEGYGMSETSGIISLNTINEHKIGSVGKPFPGVQVEIDRSAMEERPNNDGEIVVCGPNIMKGYHNLPEQSLAIMPKPGCLRTGDLGHFDEEGYLFITGRVKEIYKMKNGVYVVPGIFENRAKLSPYFKEALLYGDNQDFNVALLVVDLEYLQKTAKKLAISSDRCSDLLKHPKIDALLKEEVEKMRAAVPVKNDFPKTFTVISDEWTQENGLLTPTMKVKRGAVEKKYHERLMAMYQ